MKRIEILLRKLEDRNLDGLFLVTDHNIRYLSRFTDSDSYLLISNRENYLITDGRYTEQAKEECPDFKIVNWRQPSRPCRLTEVVSELVDKLGLKRLGFESACVTYDMYEKLVEDVSMADIVPTKGIVDELRYTKDENEIENMRKAAEIADNAFNKILDYIKPGITEKEAATQLEYYLKKFGADAPGFETILISGTRTSLLHGKPSDKKIEYGDFITMDFGSLYEGYISDMTRTIVVGKPTEKQKEIYNLVKRAQEAGLEAIKAEVSGKLPDDKVREVIEDGGYIDMYYPGLGHGVGLLVHEEPYMGINSKDTLKKNCVVTVEPGIYIPKWGGVRIEDMILVKEEGCEILTKSPKDLIII